MAILARLNLDGQCISAAAAYKDMKVTTDASPLKEGLHQGEGRGRRSSAP